MNTHQKSFHIVRSRHATEALAIARKRGMTMRVVGQGDVPLEPFYRDEWWYESVTQESTIPAEGLRRIKELKKAGVLTKGIVIAHEAPRLLSAPPTNPHESVRNRDFTGAQTGEIDVQRILSVIGAVLMSVFTVFGFVLITAIRLDPALIVVLQDDTWLEILTWYE